MAARQFYYNESLSESTVSSTTYTDKVVLTFTPDDNSDYLLLWSAKETNTSAITADWKVRLFHDTATTVIDEYNIESKDVSQIEGDYQCIHGMQRVSFGASPGSQTFSIEFAGENAAHVIRIASATITALKMDAADEYAESEGSSATSSATFQDKTTLTFTPATTGDYLIISNCEFHDANVSNSEERLLDSASVVHALNEREPKDGTNWYPWGTAVQQNLSNSSKTFKIQWRSVAGIDSMDIRRARIVALRLDTFPAEYYAESLSRTTTTSATYVNKTSLTQTPTAQDHLRIACGINDGNSSSVSYYWNFDQAGSLFECLYESQGTGGPNGDCKSVMTYSVYSAAASSTTWNIQHKADTAVTAGMSDATISILQLTEPAAPHTPVASFTLPQLGKSKHAFTGWQQAPLAASGPAEMALGATYEVPYNNEQRALRRHSMQGWQQSPQPTLAAGFPPEPVYELPQRGRQKNSFSGWLQAPLSDDSLPEIRQQPYYVPERDRNKLWIKHSFQGFQAAPTIPELDLICRWWYDLPQGTWRWTSNSYQGLQAGPLPDEFDVPLPLTTLPVETWRSGSDSFQGIQAGPLPDDVADPPIPPFYALPVRTWTSERHSYQGWELAPQPEIMSPPPPQYSVPMGRFDASLYQSFQKGVIPDEFDVPLPQTALPPVGRQTKDQYEGMRLAAIRAETLPPPRGSMHFDLPPQSRASSWRMQQAYTGSSVAPTPGDVAPAIPHMWLPLIGVGNGGP